ncbi:histidine phosphatase family protein [Candidatus Gracilibacteria bacterium]|nr:histidine phosphatase family protein [Candidatus Gracilibacteria bacterium]NJM88787.1 histidine phosphatase family protein [Hydrococcus sp. RU_2_2]NJP21842.1 histidine phosphatase family protein [Hydrococcus sp. CRU_1_1]
MRSRKSEIWTNLGACLFLSAASVAIAFQINLNHVQANEQPTTSITQSAQESQEAPAFQDKLTGADLVNALRSGGYIIYFRHAQTEKDYADQVSAKMGDCSTQRMLSEMGWQQAREIGKAFEDLQIPVGQVYSSEYCRAWQTADLAFGRYEKNPGLNFASAEDYTEAQVKQMRDAVMPMLTAMPANVTNTVIVGHDDVFEAATGIYPEPQGVAYILKPDGQGSFEIIANMLPDEWAKLSSP